MTTSAPRSPNNLPQNCPVSPASSRMRRPAKGPGRYWVSLTGAFPPCTGIGWLCRRERAVVEAGAQLVTAIAEQAFDNLPRMLPDQRARQVIERGSLRQFERGILPRAIREPGVRWAVHFPVAQLRIMLNSVLGALHRKRTNSFLWHRSVTSYLPRVSVHASIPLSSSS